jgi:hypothetical protein
MLADGEPQTIETKLCASSDELKAFEAEFFQAGVTVSGLLVIETLRNAPRPSAAAARVPAPESPGPRGLPASCLSFVRRESMTAT